MKFSEDEILSGPKHGFEPKLGAFLISLSAYAEFASNQLDMAIRTRSGRWH